jgi:hypothetical protein
MVVAERRRSVDAGRETWMGGMKPAMTPLLRRRPDTGTAIVRTGLVPAIHEWSLPSVGVRSMQEERRGWPA